MNITTERNNNDFKYNQIVFEWEDDFTNYFGSRLIEMGQHYNNKYADLIFEKLLNPIPFSGNDTLSFVLFVRLSHRYKFKCSLPVYLDVHPRWIDKIIHDCRKLSVYFVTSYDIYQLIRDKRDYRCEYIPLFISDRYINKRRNSYDKSIDIVQLGRKNIFLHDCALKYADENPDREYIYFDQNGYVSTKNGFLGDLKTRDEYMKLLQSAKISLVSTPAMDPSKDFGGTDFFTPRFYESMASDCYLVGKYSNNAEARILSMDKYCPNIQNYEEFVSVINNDLSEDNTRLREFYSSFLYQNCSSARAKFIQEKLDYTKKEML